ncbi:serine hydrolase domain-containing protein [Allokutzneria oryzae]|uniref:Serine hydrolase domain-containing protein n=1 Tax=Allokutzneria oryzae TaxID=1378989 RepID=A0ABV6A141_9PSEU
MQDYTELLAELCRSHRVPAAQLVVCDAEGSTDTTFGTAKPDTVFPLGSLTKPFTAALAMVLVEDGDLDLDEPLGEHLPELDQAVTLRQVLSHTGGWASNIDEDADHTANRAHWLANHWRDTGLVHRPGEVFSYSNIGYLVAGHLVEVVTGMDWAEAVEEILLRPWGITPSFVTSTGTTGSRGTAEGHTVLPDGRVVPVGPQSVLDVEAPNGGLALSATDLVTFVSTHLTSAEVFGEMCRDQLGSVAVGPFGMADSWGLGWARYGSWSGHDGTGDGTSCHLRFDQGTGNAVALTTNAGTGLDLWRDLAAKLGVADEGLGDPGEPVPADPEAVGRYVNGPSEFVVSQGREGALELAFGPAPAVELTCFERLRFTARALPGSSAVLSGRFLPDPATGRVELLQISGRLARRHG